MKYKFFPKYMDKWGQIWIKHSSTKVKRVSDDNIGGWFKGEGLKKI